MSLENPIAYIQLTLKDGQQAVDVIRILNGSSREYPLNLVNGGIYKVAPICLNVSEKVANDAFELAAFLSHFVRKHLLFMNYTCAKCRSRHCLFVESNKEILYDDIFENIHGGSEEIIFYDESSILSSFGRSSSNYGNSFSSNYRSSSNASSNQSENHHKRCLRCNKGINDSRCSFCGFKLSNNTFGSFNHNRNSHNTSSLNYSERQSLTKGCPRSDYIFFSTTNVSVHDVDKAVESIHRELPNTRPSSARFNNFNQSPFVPPPPLNWTNEDLNTCLGSRM